MGNKSFIFSFGDVEVREREFTLVKAGVAQAVEPKAFRVLLILLRSSQKLVSKEELMKAVWGDAAVTDNSLTRSIALLRKVLGDDAHQPRYIETVATVGYRFLSPVEVEEEVSAGAEAGGTAVPPIKDRRRGIRGRWIGVAAVVLAGLAGVGWWLSRPLPLLRVAGYTKITNDGRFKILGGTDGSRVYFSFRSPNEIGQVGVNGGEIAKVPVAVPRRQLTVRDVSPDGADFLVNSIPVERDADILWNVGILGGLMRRLGDAEWGAFSPDGKSVVLSPVGRDIYVAGSDGTEAHRLATPGDGVRWPRWSPDGKVIRFERGDKLWEMTADGNGIHALLPDGKVEGRPTGGQWSPDGKFYFFLLSTVQHSGGQLWAIDERRRLFGKKTAQPFQLTSGPILWFEPVVGRDGKTIFSVGQSLRGELSRLDEKTGRLEPFLGGISAEFVSFSKDSKQLAYVSFPEGVLWKANLDGSSPVQLTDSPMYPVVPLWSPDGKQIVFMEGHNPEHFDSYVMSAEGGSPRRLLANNDEVSWDPMWSPDGKILFCRHSDGPPATEDLRILDLASHQVSVIPGSSGLYSPRWSPDGRTILALARMAPYLRVFDVATRRWSALPTNGIVAFPWFSSDSQTITFLRYGVDQGIYRIRVEKGKEERIADMKDWHLTGIAGMSMTLDPTDAPLVMRDIGGNDVFALKLEEK
jgi:Tol biopolymer transport system component/DNA-binding winged helix-turn-helix (wHTH) protein